MKKIQIESDRLCFGPMPRPNTEMEQRLTINEKGQVWLTRYRFGNREDECEFAAKEYFRITKEDAEEIFRLAEEVLTVRDDMSITDVGEWMIIITDSNNHTRSNAGPLVRIDSEPINQFCQKIRKTVNLKGLFLLDGRR